MFFIPFKTRDKKVFGIVAFVVLFCFIFLLMLKFLSDDFMRWCRWYGYRPELQNERTSWQGTSSPLRHKKLFYMVRAWNCENLVKDIIVSDSIRFLGKPGVVGANYFLEYT